MKEYSQLVLKMMEHEEGCPQRIQHFLKVWAFARLIGELEALDEDTMKVLEIAAVVHDIGIKPSLEKYGNAKGSYQELEGPPIAVSCWHPWAGNQTLSTGFVTWWAGIIPTMTLMASTIAFWWKQTFGQHLRKRHGP